MVSSHYSSHLSSASDLSRNLIEGLMARPIEAAGWSGHTVEACLYLMMRLSEQAARTE